MIFLLAAALASEPSVERGDLLAGLAGCAACHTAEDGVPYAGGHAIQTRYGTFFGTNITPDPLHGIGTWTLEDFVRAMRKGKSPKGRPYWPAFPYPSFSAMTDSDLADLWAFLQTIAADPRPREPHLRTRGRVAAGLWRALFFREGDLLPGDPTWSADIRRGAYLVHTVGHCGECHTPRSRLGRLDTSRRLAGGTDPATPNLSPHPDGLQHWTEGDWTTFFMFAMDPDGDVLGGEMGRIVEEGTARLSDDDRRAMAAYLRQVTPSPDPAR